MPEVVRVTPEDLHVSAVTVDTYADNVQAQHFAADNRMEAAQRGLPVGSAAALNLAITKWQADTSKIFGRMIDHADGFRSGAAAYQQVDSRSASQIQDAGQAAREIDLGL